jgi:3-oxoacyl-[acyl-carrier protein] reductase
MSDHAGAPAAAVPAATTVPAATAVLVSGGSRGLGLAIATDLLEQGLRVAAFARTVTPALQRLVKDYPDRAYVDALDLTDAPATAEFLRSAEAALGPLDGLVNNAAVGQDSLLAHTSPARLAEIITTNLTAPLALTRLVVRRALGAGRRGRIVNITSICAQRGFPGLVAYSATKAGLEGATRSLARELGGRALVNAVAPGFFASEMSAVLGPTQLDQIIRRTPTGALTEPAQVVPVVRMLLCEDTNINGQVIVVDGAAAS